MTESLTRISNCYDSHVHWQGTGEFETRLHLKDLASENEISDIRPARHHFRGEWLTGFGWDQNLWPTKAFPSRHSLDLLFPDRPVAFTRADGHAFWVNTTALKKAGFWDASPDVFSDGSMPRDEDGHPTGLLVDLAMDPIRRLIPEPSDGEIEEFLRRGIARFHRAGFTHIRDLSGDEKQWKQELKLARNGELRLAVERFFDWSPDRSFADVISLAADAKRNRPELIRVKGVKIYYDGALGSEGALLSKPYSSGAVGLELIPRRDLADMLRKIWSADLEAAVHVIGDEAAHLVTLSAVEAWASHPAGTLHLEHAEMMRPETIRLLEGRPVVCHMQPCHWLSDRRWLGEKVGTLFQYAFPWRLFEQHGISFDFGSDSPIEPPSVSSTVEALRDAAKMGIPSLQGDPLRYHVHGDKGWTPETYTTFDREHRVQKVVFRGETQFTR